MISVIGLFSSITFAGFIYVIVDFLSGQKALEKRLLKQRLRALTAKPQIEIEKKEKFSNIALLNDQLLKKRSSLRKLQRLLEIAGWPFSLTVFFLLFLFLGTIVYALTQKAGASSLTSVGLSLVVVIAMPAAILRNRYQNYIHLFTINFPKALQVIRGALSAGLDLGTAFEQAANDAPYPVNLEFQHCKKLLLLGGSLSSALAALAVRIPTQDVKSFKVAINVQQESGGNIENLMRNIEETVEMRTTLRKEMKVLTAQARLSGWLITLLPFFLGGLIYCMNPVYMSTLFTTSGGHKLLYAMLGLQSIGFIFIRKIVTVKIKT